MPDAPAFVKQCCLCCTASMDIESSFNDPRFQPPPMNKAFIMNAFKSLAARHDFFDARKAGWLVPFILNADAANAGIDRMVRDAIDADPDAVDRLFRRPLRSKQPARVFDVPKLLADYAAQDGMIDAGKADYMVPIIALALSQNEYVERLASLIKTAPPLLDVAAKRAASINPRLKIGAPFAACLTDIGKARAAEVAKDVAGLALDLIVPPETVGPDDRELLAMIMAEPSRARRRRRDLVRSVESKSPVRFSAVLDRRACEAARAAHDSIFETADQPLLPLPECTSIECLCMLHPMPRRRSREAADAHSAPTAYIPPTPVKRGSDSADVLLWIVGALIIVLVLVAS